METFSDYGFGDWFVNSTYLYMIEKGKGQPEPGTVRKTVLANPRY